MRCNHCGHANDDHTGPFCTECGRILGTTPKPKVEPVPPPRQQARPGTIKDTWTVAAAIALGGILVAAALAGGGYLGDASEWGLAPEDDQEGASTVDPGEGSADPPKDDGSSDGEGPEPKAPANSMSDPAPLGAAIRSSHDGEVADLTALEVWRGVEARKMLRTLGGPDQGNEYLIVKVHLDYVSGDGRLILPQRNLQAWDAGSGLELDEPPYWAANGTWRPPSWPSGMQPGSSFEGYLVYEVPIGSPVVLTYDPDRTGDAGKVYLALNKT